MTRLSQKDSRIIL